jgi:hypothetical protein
MSVCRIRHADISPRLGAVQMNSAFRTGRRETGSYGSPASVRFDNSANLQTLATLKRGNAPSQAVEILAHIEAVSQLWLARATGTPLPSSMWPRWTLAEIEAQLDSYIAGWNSSLARHLGRSFDYVNSNRRNHLSFCALSSCGKMVLSLRSQPILFSPCELAIFDCALFQLDCRWQGMTTMPKRSVKRQF